MSLLRQAIRTGSFLLDLKANDLESIIHQAVNLVVARGALAPEHRDEVKQLLITRERVACTAIGRFRSPRLQRALHTASDPVRPVGASHQSRGGRRGAHAFHLVAAWPGGVLRTAHRRVGRHRSAYVG